MTIVTALGGADTTTIIEDVFEYASWGDYVTADDTQSFGIELTEDTRIVFSGSGLGVYDGNFATSGTITSIVIYTYDYGAESGEWYEVTSFTGMNVSAAAIAAAVGDADHTAGDAAFIAALLAGDDTLVGATTGDTLYGYGGNDTISSEDPGNDTFDGGAGDDVLYGYGVYNAWDTLRGGDGEDTLLLHGSFTLDFRGYTFSSFEKVTFDPTSTNGIVAHFNSSQVVAGFSPSLILSGSSLADNLRIDMDGASMNLGGWSFLNWNESIDRIELTGNEVANTVIGTGMADVLFGLGGNDTLRGGAGNDSFGVSFDGMDKMYGGAGDDRYGVDDARDQVIELTGEGIDRVATYVDKYVLPENVEYLTLMTDTFGRIPLVGTGNALANIIRGNYGWNTLDGAGGADVIYGGFGNDVLIGGQGGDYLLGETGDDTASYVTSTAGVQVNLTTGSATGGHAVGDVFDSIENLTGSAKSDRLTGNNGVNILNGGAANDALVGGRGADTLNGGAGRDTLTGGAHADKFVFNVAASNANADTITDFTRGSDKIQLQNSVLTALGPAGNLAASKFVVGANAGDANDRIIYNSSTGALYYDADGSGAGAKLLIATLTTRPSLAASDIQVI